jgi:hypothetical protein
MRASASLAAFVVSFLLAADRGSVRRFANVDTHYGFVDLGAVVTIVGR